MSSPVLESARLRLRPAVPHDLDWLHALWTDADVRRYLWDDVVIPRERAQEELDRALRDAEQRRFGLWIVQETEGGSAVGFCSLRSMDDGTPELLYGYRPDGWGRGVATEAARTVVDYAFDALGEERVVAAADVANGASVRVLERLGFLHKERRVENGAEMIELVLPRGGGEPCLVILKTGSTFEELRARDGDFEDWIAAGLSAGDEPAARIRTVDARTASELAVPPRVTGVVVTGSPDMVTDAPAWLEEACRWLRLLVRDGTPVLGICYGHQLLAHALGGEVGWNPGGRVMGTGTAERLPAARGDELLAHLPERFPAHFAHKQSVLRLPGGAVPVIKANADPHAAVRYGARAWGVQFHPEFSESILRSYVERRRADVLGEGGDPDGMLETIEPSPAGRILRTFGSMCRARSPVAGG